MKQYQFLLFDLDDTLLDFGAAEKHALPKLFAAHGFTLTEDIKAIYKEINGALWDALEQGLVTREELMATRFAKTFEVLGKRVDGIALDTEYRGYLTESKIFVPDALSIVQQLSQQYDLYITSNGISDTQHRRLQITGLAPHFKQVFVSEDTGYQKPMKQFFDYVFERIPQFDEEKTLIVGDSYSADIMGGVAAGIDTCWLNPIGKQAASVEPTYTITQLRQLTSIL
ncbi:MAG: YjjG family noncanonical pyrimidine nucleotidase [Solibacillus sp.]